MFILCLYLYNRITFNWMKGDENITMYRHELKYVVNEMEIAILLSRLRILMKMDPNVIDDGYYNIRSLYFDDYYNNCLREIAAGTDPREKFRIRIYNANTEKISLELKRKENGKTYKQSCPITIEQCKQLMRGVPLIVSSQDHDILHKLNYLMRTRLMKPSIIVDYDRIPYICKEGNVRVTFDKNIASSKNLNDFLNPNITKRMIMPTGQQILEVKFDEFMPDYIKDNIEIATLRQTSFSKFYYCSKFK